MMLSGTHDCDDMFYYTSGLKKCVDDTGKIQIEMSLEKNTAKSMKRFCSIMSYTR